MKNGTLKRREFLCLGTLVALDLLAGQGNGQELVVQDTNDEGFAISGAKTRGTVHIKEEPQKQEMKKLKKQIEEHFIFNGTEQEKKNLKYLLLEMAKTKTGKRLLNEFPTDGTVKIKFDFADGHAGMTYTDLNKDGKSYRIEISNNQFGQLAKSADLENVSKENFTQCIAVMAHEIQHRLHFSSGVGVREDLCYAVQNSVIREYRALLIEKKKIELKTQKTFDTMSQISKTNKRPVSAVQPQTVRWSRRQRWGR